MARVSAAAEALKNEGNARKAAGDLDGAIGSYRRALELDPDYVAALYNLGLTWRELHEPDQAEGCFRRLLAIDARDVEALFNLGALLRRRLRLEEAAEVYRRALELAPGNPHLWLMLGELGVAIYSAATLQQAAQCFTRAAELQPDLADAHYYLGNVHSFEGRHAQALAAYDEALRLGPDNAAYRAQMLTTKQRLCDWSGLGEHFARLRRGLAEQGSQPVAPFTLLSIPSTPEEQLLCATRYAGRLVEGAARQRERLKFRFDATRKPRIRIGYLSAEFHAHATAYLTAELFELHDRARFEIVAFSYGPDEESPVRERLKRAFDRFLDIRASPDDEAARAIHAEGIDILVDLKGYTFRARPEIAALRPAPLQVSYLGYPGTMGAPFIDYVVGDRFVTPPGNAAYYSEKLVLLPDCYQVNDRRRPLGIPPGRSELSLPEHGVVLCCFNQSYKILPDVFAAWMRILKAVPDSTLWLLDWDPSASQNLRREAGKAGVDAARLVFSPLVPLEAHVARMQVADLFLDTFPVNAHTTASEALWAGLPLLTCAQDTFVSRVAGSLLHAVGLPQLVTTSLAEYEALALQLARAPGELAALRGGLVAARGSAVLFDTPRFARHLENAYEQMWRLHGAGESPRLLAI